MNTKTTHLVLGILCAACSASPKINVGTEPDGSVAGSGGTSGASGFGGGGFGGGSNALTAKVTEPPSEMEIEVITVGCAGDCKQVLAIATGGNPPYAFAWNDGVIGDSREVCADEDTTFTVAVTDTATTGDEFDYEGQTATASVTMQVLTCPAEGGVPSASVAWAEWMSWNASTPNVPGNAQATITHSTRTIDVTYAGEVNAASALAGAPNTFTPESTWTSISVANGPPAYGHVAVNGIEAYTSRITFSEPVRNPLIAFWSIGFGSLGVPMEIELGQDGVILSTGPNSYGLPGDIMQVGRRLRATEGNGVVEVQGTFQEITFTVPTPEALGGYTAFTVGARE